MENKQDLNWLMDKTDKYQERYMEAERFIMELLKMKWYERIFCVGKILEFLNSRKKYKF
jgi:hypothetical protein